MDMDGLKFWNVRRWSLVLALLWVGIAGCDTGGCAGDDGETVDVGLAYELEIDEAVDHQGYAAGLRLVDDIGDHNIDGQIMVHRREGERAAELRLSRSEDIGVVDEALADMSELEVVDRGARVLRIQLAERAVNQLQDQAMEAFIPSLRARLEDEGFDDFRLLRTADPGFHLHLAEFDRSDLPRLKATVEDRRELRFPRADLDESDRFFGQFDGALPDGFEMRQLFGHFNTVTHPDRDALRDFFAGRAPEGYRVGYQFEPKQQGDERSGPSSDSPLLDDDMFEGSGPIPAHWKSILVEEDSPLEGRHLTEAYVDIDEEFNRPVVALRFDEVGTEVLADFTAENIGNTVAMMAGDQIFSTPRIQESITEGALRINLSERAAYDELQDEARELVVQLRALSVPYSLKLTDEVVE